MSGAAAAAVRREIPFASGLRILSSVRQGGDTALSEYASCVVPLLNALGWRGEERHLAEAVPHFSDNLDLDGVVNVFANLGYALRPLRLRQDRLRPGMLPCLFVPRKGSVRVVLAAEPDGTLRIHDGWSRSEKVVRPARLAGTAYVARRVSDDPVATAAQPVWTTRLFRRFSSLFWIFFAITGIFNVLSLSTSLFIMAVYDRVIPSGSTVQLGYLALGMLAALGFELAFRNLRARLLGHVAGRIDYAIGTAAFRQVLYLPAMFTEIAPVGGQLARLREFESVREFFTGPLAEALLDLPFVLLFLGIIALLGGWLVMVPVLIGIAFVVLHLLIAAEVRRCVATTNRLKSRLQQFMVETVSGLRALKLSADEVSWVDRYREASASAAMAEFRSAMVTNLIQTLAQALMLTAGMALVSFGAFQVMDGTLTMGALIALMALGWRSLSPLQSGFLALNRSEQIRNAFRQINQLMRLPPERAPGSVPPRRVIDGGLTFAHVSYKYSPDGDPTLLGVSLSIKPGEVVAVSGRNGSGKSTVLKLAAGIYRPQSGTVLIDGTDIRQIDPIDLRQSIGLAPQDAQFFYGTIAQNLRMSVPGASDAQLRAATEEALVYDEIMALPDRFETRLSERVLGELPAGFKQKLSLARAFLRDSAILILDEPGQSLDAGGDKALIEAIVRRRGRTTVLMVTHRPSHMRIADRLIVLDAGRVEFDGPPARYLQAPAARGG